MTGDTAVSVLTPPGSGAIATVAVRGPNAWQLVKENFRPAKGSLPDAPELRRVWFGNFGAGIGDEVILGGKAADEFEIHCHGGVAVVRWMVEQFTAAGCLETNPYTFDRSCVDPRALEPLTRATTVRTAAILLDQLNGAWLRGVAQTSPPSPLSEAERGNRNGDHLPLCVSERGGRGVRSGSESVGTSLPRGKSSSRAPRTSAKARSSTPSPASSAASWRRSPGRPAMSSECRSLSTVGPWNSAIPPECEPAQTNSKRRG